MRRFLFFAMFVGLPLAELYLVLAAAARFGALTTLLLLILSAFAGTTVMRHHGIASLARLRSAMAGGQSPAGPMLEGLLAQIAGLLLVVPGFITDAIGVCLLIAPLRRRLATRMTGPRGTVAGARVRIIEGEFRSRDDS
ncbi:FxsA family protein [Immundisolibacter sp.]